VGGGVEIALVELAVDVAGEVTLVELAVDVAGGEQCWSTW